MVLSLAHMLVASENLDVSEPAYLAACSSELDRFPFPNRNPRILGLLPMSWNK
jgi:hypothetical protein